MNRSGSLLNGFSRERFLARSVCVRAVGHLVRKVQRAVRERVERLVHDPLGRTDVALSRRTDGAFVLIDVTTCHTSPPQGVPEIRRIKGLASKFVWGFHSLGGSPSPRMKNLLAAVLEPNSSNTPFLVCGLGVGVCSGARGLTGRGSRTRPRSAVPLPRRGRPTSSTAARSASPWRSPPSLSVLDTTHRRQFISYALVLPWTAATTFFRATCVSDPM